MRRIFLFPTRTLVFHGFLPWFLTKLTALLMAGAKCIELAVRSSNLWWLIGLALCAGTAVWLATRYNTEIVAIQEVTLLCRRGALLTHEVTLPLWPLVLEIRQNLLGRALNYGTIRLQVNDTTIDLRNIAHIGLLRTAIAQRQTEILLSNRYERMQPGQHPRPRAA